MLVAETEHGAGGAPPGKLLEDGAQCPLDLLIRIELDPPVAAVDVAGRQPQAQLPALRLAAPRPPQPLLDAVQLDLADGPPQAQQQPILRQAQD